MGLRIIGSIGALILVLGRAGADAQVVAEGRAFGAQIFQGSSEVFPASPDTGNQIATEGIEPQTYDTSAAGGTTTVPGIGDVLAGEVRVRGSARIQLPAEPFVLSQAGDSGVDGPVLQVLTSGAVVSGSCEQPTPVGTSGLRALSIGGTSIIDGPQSFPPNTTQEIPGIARFIFNEQIPFGGTGVEVRAFHGFIPPEGGGEFIFSSAAARLENLPPECGGTSGSCLFASRKNGAIIQDAGTPGVIEPGDRVRYTIRAVNDGPGCTQELPNVVAIDRLPDDLTFDAASVRVAGQPAVAQSGPCPSGFEQCGDEPSSRCLTISIGTVQAGEGNAVEATFEGTIGEGAFCADAEGEICNTVLLRGDDPATQVERVNVLDFGTPGNFCDDPFSDSLVTTGSGGCSVGGRGARRADLSAIGALIAIAALRMRRRRRCASSAAPTDA